MIGVMLIASVTDKKSLRPGFPNRTPSNGFETANQKETSHPGFSVSGFIFTRFSHGFEDRHFTNPEDFFGDCAFGARRATPSTTMIRQFRQPAGLFRSGWRELLNDLLKKRVAAERVPEGEGLEHSVVGAIRWVDSGLNDKAQLLDSEIFLACPRRGHSEIGAYYWSIERVL